jgi:hypothetical protein
LNLSSEKLVSKFGFKCNVYRPLQDGLANTDVLSEDDVKVVELVAEVFEGYNYVVAAQGCYVGGAAQVVDPVVDP